MELSQRRRDYWRRNLRLTALLMVIWFLVTFVVGYYADAPWLRFEFFGWPFSFYMGAQGSLIVYLAIIWFYARYMNRLDREYGVGEGGDE